MNIETLSRFSLKFSVAHSYYIDNEVSQLTLLIIKKFLTHCFRFEELRFQKDTRKFNVKGNCSRLQVNIKLPSKSAYLLSHTVAVAGADVEKHAKIWL